MVLSSSILFVAGNLQTLSTMASCSNDSLLMIARSLPAFAKQFGGDIERTFSTLISHRNRLFGTLRPVFWAPPGDSPQFARCREERLISANVVQRN